MSSVVPFEYERKASISRRERKHIPAKQRIAMLEETVQLLGIVLLETCRVAGAELTQALKRPSRLNELLEQLEAQHRKGKG